MLEGKTSTGFKYRIEDEVLSNYELLDTISEIENNPLMIPKLVNMLLGTEQKKALMEHLRDEKGFVPTEAVSKELADIFQAKQIKN